MELPKLRKIPFHDVSHKARVFEEFCTEAEYSIHFNDFHKGNLMIYSLIDLIKMSFIIYSPSCLHN